MVEGTDNVCRCAVEHHGRREHCVGVDSANWYTERGVCPSTLEKLIRVRVLCAILANRAVFPCSSWRVRYDAAGGAVSEFIVYRPVYQSCVPVVAEDEDKMPNE